MRRKLISACLSLTALALVLSGTAFAGAGRGVPPADSPNAGGIQDLYLVVLGVTGVIFVIVEGALLLFIFRFRGRGRVRTTEGPQIRGHTRLELIWTAIPALILVGIITVVFFKLPGIKDVPDAGAAGPKMTVQVEGRQFYWRYTYPNGAVSINELVVPAQRPIYLVITAPDFDVIHSWWVPQLAGKMDAVPGKVNDTWFEAERPGIYQGQCAEFCGIQHAMMLTRVRAVTNGEYESWAAHQLQVSANIGRMTFEGACAPCHGLQGQGVIGPALKGNATVADPERLRAVVEHGKGRMPPVGNGWSAKEIASLIRYLKQEFASGG